VAVPIEHWLRSATEQLQASSESARLDSECLLAHVLGQNRTWLYTWSDRGLTAEQLSAANALLQRRIAGEPVAYLCGQRDFWSLTLDVNPSTLIPRGDTETLIEWALELPVLATANVLDLGTGTGAIALALASEQPSWHVQGVKSKNGVSQVVNKLKKLRKTKDLTHQQDTGLGTRLHRK